MIARYGLRRTVHRRDCTGRPDRPRIPTRALARLAAAALSRGDVRWTLHRDWTREWRRVR